jgi:hypothetical protein
MQWLDGVLIKISLILEHSSMLVVLSFQNGEVLKAKNLSLSRLETSFSAFVGCIIAKDL